MNTERNCPICGEGEAEILYQYTTTYHGYQKIYACYCGMVYASSTAPSYSESIYSRPSAYGAGETPEDRRRLNEACSLIARDVKRDAQILDVGCARGGMLDALRFAGFDHLTGIDLSIKCVNETRERGHRAFLSDLWNMQEKYDLIIFSHVLEHVDNPKLLLRQAVNHLNPDGHIYVEVPDAERHSGYSLPFLEFNSEHINHFGKDSLPALLDKCGLEGLLYHRVLDLANHVRYPVLSVIAKRHSSTERILCYVEKSQKQMQRLNAHLCRELNGAEGCVIWGAGEYYAHVASLPVFKSCPILQVVDTNMAGRKDSYGFTVEHPNVVRGDIPIVIAALTAAPISIKADIERMGLKNKVITLEMK